MKKFSVKPLPKNAEYFLGRIYLTHPDEGVALNSIINKYRAVAEAAKRGPCRHDSSHTGMATCEVCQALAALEAGE